MDVRSIWDLRARQQAAQLAYEGQPIAVYNRTVNALFGRGESLRFFDEVVRIKGEARQSRPLAFFYRASETAGMVDPTQIPPDLHHIFLDPDELEGRFGGLAFLRLPVRPEVAARIPEQLLSRRDDGVPVMMVSDPTGQTGVDLLLRDMHRAGVRHMSGTSMNRSGTREIVDQAAGIEFAREAGVPLFLTDAMGTGRVLGSPTIFTVDRSGVRLIRDSYLPWRVFEPLFGMPIDPSGTRPANWPQLDPPLLASNPRALRRKLLDFVQRQASAHYLRDAALVGSAVLAENLFGWTGQSRTNGVVRLGRRSPGTPAVLSATLATETARHRETEKVAA
jgi:hypothetical protein